MKIEECHLLCLKITYFEKYRLHFVRLFTVQLSKDNLMMF